MYVPSTLNEMICLLWNHVQVNISVVVTIVAHDKMGKDTVVTEKRPKKHKYDVELLNSALSEVRQGHMSVRGAGSAFDVSASTIGDHYYNRYIYTCTCICIHVYDTKHLNYK